MLARSGKFFRNLLLRQFRESVAKTVNISNIKSNIFELVLSFIYFEEDFVKLPANTLLQEGWMNLLKAAHYFDLPKLSLFCESCLLHFIKPANIFYLLENSITYNCELLEKGCLTYIMNKYSILF